MRATMFQLAAALAELRERYEARFGDNDAIAQLVALYVAALLLGVADVAGKYYIPKMGAFIVYSLMIAILIWRPQGLFVRQGGKS